MSKDPTSLASVPQLPVVREDDGTWAVEVKAAPDTDAAPNVVYDRLGGIVRVKAFAVLRLDAQRNCHSLVNLQGVAVLAFHDGRFSHPSDTQGSLGGGRMLRAS